MEKNCEQDRWEIEIRLNGDTIFRLGSDELCMVRATNEDAEIARTALDQARTLYYEPDGNPAKFAVSRSEIIEASWDDLGQLLNEIRFETD